MISNSARDESGEEARGRPVAGVAPANITGSLCTLAAALMGDSWRSRRPRPTSTGRGGREGEARHGPCISASSASTSGSYKNSLSTLPETAARQGSTGPGPSLHRLGRPQLGESNGPVLRCGVRPAVHSSQLSMWSSETLGLTSHYSSSIPDAQLSFRSGFQHLFVYCLYN